MADFQPAAKYAGRRDGYYFSNGPRGVGYYLDAHQRPPPSVQKPGLGRTATQSASAQSRNASKESIAELLAKADSVQVEELTTASVKRMLLQFEKRINKNQMMRAKHASDPAKFVESEVDLDESLQKLHNLASSPQFYSLITSNNSHISILGLLTHENTDICLDVIALLYELTDAAVLAELGEGAGAFVDALVNNSMFELLVQNLQRLNEVSFPPRCEFVLLTVSRTFYSLCFAGVW